MVGGCRAQTVRRQPIRRWTASSRSRSRSQRKILLGCRLSNLLLVEAVKCVAAPSPVCPDSRAPSSVPRPVPRRTARGPLGPRRGQRRRPRRRRSPARTAAHGAAAHRPALTLPSTLGSRPTPPDTARASSHRRVGGRRSFRRRGVVSGAADTRVAGRCGRRRRGRGVCESSMRRARADRCRHRCRAPAPPAAAASSFPPPPSPPPPPPPQRSHCSHRPPPSLPGGLWRRGAVPGRATTRRAR